MKKSIIFLAVLSLMCSCGGNAPKKAEAPETAVDTIAINPADTSMITRQSENFIFADSTEWHDAGGGVVRQILGYNDNIMMVKVKFKKGQVGAMHSHPHSQCTYVASGVFEFTIGGVKKIVKAGDALYKQPGIEHGCVCIEDGILIDTFNPMRDNFLE